MELARLDPGTPVDQLLDLQAEAVVQRVAPDRSAYSAWSGRHGVLADYRPEDANTPWEINSDRSIDYSNDLVREPLQQLIDAGLSGIGDPADDRLLLRGKAAAFFIAQANLRLLTPGGEQWRPADGSGEQAVLDAFADRQALDLADDLPEAFGLDSPDGRLRRIDLGPAFEDLSSDLFGHISGGVDAADAVAAYAGKRAGLSPAEVVAQVNRQNPGGQAALIADLLMQDGDPAETRAATISTLHKGFAAVARASGRPTAKDLVAELRAELGDVELTAELWERQDELSLAVTGAHHSSWNHETVIGFREFTGQQVHESFSRHTVPPDPGAPGNGELEGRLAAVQPTGTIRYGPEVVAAIEEMYAAAGRDEFSDAELTRWSTAARAVLQANWMLHAPEGQEYADGQVWSRYQMDSIHRTLAEAGARDPAHLDDFIDRLGLPENLTTALKSVEPQYDDAVGTAAWVALSDSLAEGSQQHGTDVLKQLNNRTPRDNLAEAGRIALAARPLALPESHPLRQVATDIAVDRIQNTLLHHLGDIGSATAGADRNGMPLDDRLSTGTAIGTRAAEAVRHAIDDLNETLAAPDGAEQLQAMHLAGVDAPPVRRRSAGRDQGTATGTEQASRPAVQIPSAAWPGMVPNRPERSPYL